MTNEVDDTLGTVLILFRSNRSLPMVQSRTVARLISLVQSPILARSEGLV